MKFLRSASLVVLSLCFGELALGAIDGSLSVTTGSGGDLRVVVQHDFHLLYGCAYPMTYVLEIPAGSSGLEVSRRYRSSDAWTILPEKLATDLFNGIEAVRFDYPAARAYVSAAFAGDADSLFLQVTGSGGTPVVPVYHGVSRYYDNRRAVVTVTGDDCADWTNGWFPQILEVFRTHGMWVTAAIITDESSTTAPTWAILQQQVDSGSVELASHSRTHSHTPYADPVGEIIGSREDIVTHVRTGPLSSSGDSSYVYVWIAPYGDMDEVTDSLLGVGRYLIARLYTNPGDSTMSAWETGFDHFAPIEPTLEIGAPSWGGGTTSLTVLNGTFDTILAQGGVYHLMWHPQVVIGDIGSRYFLGHLSYIGKRSNVWYSGLGHLYMYHLIQMANQGGPAQVPPAEQRPNTFALLQNYPNPFNPSTTITYEVPAASRVSLRVFNVLGQQVAVLVDAVQSAGKHMTRWDAGGFPSGVYLYRLQTTGIAAGERTFSAGGKMLLVK